MNKDLQVLKNRQDDIFIRAAEILGVLSAPVRIRLIHFLSQSPLTVEVLSQKIDQSVANTSMHLRKMLNENLVRVETIGQKRLYSLHPSIFLFWEKIQDFIQLIDPSLSIVNESEEDDLNWPHTIEETVKMFKKNDVTILDVRPLDETTFVEHHEKNLIHIPFNELKESMASLPKKKKIIVVCRGRMCGLSAYTANYLRKNNFNSYRLKESWFVLNQALETKGKV